MSNVQLSTNQALRPELGIASEILLGVLLLALVYYVKIKLVRNTKDFVIANRKIGFGFGVAGLISIWTWAMAVMMSAAQTYSFGLSGPFWRKCRCRRSGGSRRAVRVPDRGDHQHQGDFAGRLQRFRSRSQGGSDY